MSSSTDYSGWVWESSFIGNTDHFQEYSTITNSKLVVYIQGEMGKTWGKGMDIVCSPCIMKNKRKMKYTCWIVWCAVKVKIGTKKKWKEVKRRPPCSEVVYCSVVKGNEKKKRGNHNTTPFLGWRLPSLLQYQNRSPIRTGHSHLFLIGDQCVSLHVWMPAIIMGTLLQDVPLLVATLTMNNVRLMGGCCVIRW